MAYLASHTGKAVVENKTQGKAFLSLFPCCMQNRGLAGLLSLSCHLPSWAGLDLLHSLSVARNSIPFNTPVTLPDRKYDPYNLTIWPNRFVLILGTMKGLNFNPCLWMKDRMTWRTCLPFKGRKQALESWIHWPPFSSSFHLPAFPCLIEGGFLLWLWASSV